MPKSAHQRAQKKNKKKKRGSCGTCASAVNRCGPGGDNRSVYLATLRQNMKHKTCTVVPGYDRSKKTIITRTQLAKTSLDEVFSFLLFYLNKKEKVTSTLSVSSTDFNG